MSQDDKRDSIDENLRWNELIERLQTTIRQDDIIEANRLFDENPDMIRFADSALKSAGRYGSFEMVKLMLDRGVKPTGTILFDTWGDDKFQLLIERGADPRIVTHHHGATDWTILHSAVRRQSADAVKLLLQLGCDPMTKAGDGDYECDGFTPMQVAAKCAFKEKREKIDLLLVAGAPMDLFTASYLGDTAIIEDILLKDPSQIYAVDAYGATGLHAAISAEKPEAFALLLSKGSDINARDRRGRTPILVAALTESEEMIRLVYNSRPTLDAFALAAIGRTIGLIILLQSDPNAISMKDESGWTPLHWACRVNRLAEILALLEHDADADARDNAGRTPLWLACLNGHHESAEILLDYGADVNAKENSGNGLLAYDLGELSDMLTKRGLKD